MFFLEMVFKRWGVLGLFGGRWKCRFLEFVFGDLDLVFGGFRNLYLVSSVVIVCVVC